MKVVRPKQQRSDDPEKVKKQRQGLYAKINIGKKELGILECDYREMLRQFYGVSSAKDLGIEQLADLVRHFQAVGWKPKFTKDSKKSQLYILRSRVYDLAGELPNGRRRLKGLARKLCKIDAIQWADASSLKRLLAVLERLRKEGGEE